MFLFIQYQRPCHICKVLALFKRELLDEDIVFGDIPSRNDLIFFYNLTTRTTALMIENILGLISVIFVLSSAVIAIQLTVSP